MQVSPRGRILAHATCLLAGSVEKFQERHAMRMVTVVNRIDLCTRLAVTDCSCHRLAYEGGPLAKPSDLELASWP